MRRALFLVLIVARYTSAQSANPGDYTFDHPSGTVDFDGGGSLTTTCTGSVTPTATTVNSKLTITATASAHCGNVVLGSSVDYQGTISLTVPAPIVTIDGVFIVSDPSPPATAVATYQFTGHDQQNRSVTFGSWADFNGSSKNGTGLGPCGTTGMGTASCPVQVLEFFRPLSNVPYAFGVRVGIIHPRSGLNIGGSVWFDILANYVPLTCSGTPSLLSSALLRTSGCTPNPGLEIDHIEFVQAVQSPTNTVKLAANKDTMMRIFPKVVGSNQNPLPGVTATVSYMLPNGQAVNAALKRPVTATTAPDRQSLSNSFNPTLPIEMTTPGTKSFTVSLVYPPGMTDPTPNDPNRTVTVTATFQNPTATNPLRIDWLSFCFHFLNGQDVCPSGSVASHGDLTSEILPIPRPPSSPGATLPPRTLLYNPLPVRPFRLTVSAANNAFSDLTAKILATLDAIKFVLDLGGLPGQQQADGLIAWAAPIEQTTAATAIHAPDGIAYIFDAGASQGLDLGTQSILSFRGAPVAAKRTLASVTAVLLGGQPVHTPASIGEIGIDVAKRELFPESIPDFLGPYEIGFDAWISAFDWQQLGQALGTIPPARVAPPTSTPERPQASSTEYALITGSVQQDNSSAQINPILRMTSSSVLAPPSSSGAYCLQIGNGSVVSANPCFDIDFTQGGLTSSSTSGTFAVRVPWPAGATQIQLMHGGSQLASLSAGTANPTVAITSPHQGDQWNGPNTLTWNASATGGVPVTSTVLYSYDGGVSWVPMAVSIPDTQFAVDTTAIKGGSQVFFRVIVSSGINTASATVGPITVNQTPAIQVPSSANFGTQTTGQSIDQTITIANSGTGPLTVQTLATDNAAFIVTFPPTPFDVGAGSGTDVTIRFAAADSGAVNGNLIVTSNDPSHGTVHVPLTANSSATISPALVPLPATLNFGNVAMGNTLDLIINIANNGSDTLNVTAATTTGSFQITSGAAPFSVPPYGQHGITVRFSPASAGAQMGSLAISTNDPAHPTASVSLQGNGIVACIYALNTSTASAAGAGGSGSITLTAGPACTWGVLSNAPWLTTTPTSGSGNGTINYSVSANNTTSQRIGVLTVGTQTFTVTQAAPGVQSSGLQFIPVTPCRIIDTRLANGNFGGPAIAAGGTRMVPIPLSACNIPATAQAYSLNATVVPIATLGYLSIWPAGQNQPVVSTLNSYDGRVVANAAIVPAGTNGAINLFASDATHVILDINGYFAPASTPNSLSFYSLTPCRVADTRSTSLMTGNSTRNFTISGAPCNAPSTAKAYSLNITVVPRGQLGYLTTWPAGQTQPVVSTLNSTDGSVVANAAIVPAGTGGAISMYVTDNTDVIIDINGYFAPPGSPAAQSLYTVTPCRVVDTRSSGGALGANGQRSFPVPAGPCPGIPATSQAYSLNVTVVPTNTLTYLTAWPSGQTQPVVSTLNSFLGKIVANAAIVPAGQNAAISVFVTDPTHLILDINAYFAP